MSTNTRCPKCGKLNPIPTTETAMEHTCIFCGTIIPPQTEAKQGDATKNKGLRRFPLAQSETKPVNKNLRKPML